MAIERVCENRLKELREARGLRREHIAVYLNCSAAAVVTWELGIREIPEKRRGQLAELLGVTRAHLMGYDRDETVA